MDLAKRRAVLDEAMEARGDWPERAPWLREAVGALPRDGFALRVALPDALIATGRDEDGVNAWVHDGVASWASFSAVGDGTAVLHQGGERLLGDELLHAWTQWEELGRPEPYDYGVTVTEDRQFAWLNNQATGPRWPIHEPAVVNRGGPGIRRR
ncbi:hypothetical protein [Kitasatospora sp. NPDC093806]|uniref:hypothetical protein n=1 Tax=Kitasatospora sp. NPDC093806 TaxID=3155075 RepID=UPI00343A3225